MAELLQEIPICRNEPPGELLQLHSDPPAPVIFVPLHIIDALIIDGPPHYHVELAPFAQAPLGELIVHAHISHMMQNVLQNLHWLAVRDTVADAIANAVRGSGKLRWRDVRVRVVAVQDVASRAVAVTLSHDVQLPVNVNARGICEHFCRDLCHCIEEVPVDASLADEGHAACGHHVREGLEVPVDLHIGAPPELVEVLRRISCLVRKHSATDESIKPFVHLFLAQVTRARLLSAAHPGQMEVRPWLRCLVRVRGAAQQARRLHDGPLGVNVRHLARRKSTGHGAKWLSALALEGPPNHNPRPTDLQQNGLSHNFA
mmetsp:Transcript_22169/g.66318  ORF Transcript_22169/g.66318 Transcript_22169/m.66318 type:complete len:316 (-) Transcript_22169:22-969(-)